MFCIKNPFIALDSQILVLWPLATVAFLTRSFSVWAEQPILLATETAAAQRDD